MHNQVTHYQQWSRTSLNEHNYCLALHFVRKVDTIEKIMCMFFFPGDILNYPSFSSYSDKISLSFSSFASQQDFCRLMTQKGELG